MSSLKKCLFKTESPCVHKVVPMVVSPFPTLPSPTMTPCVSCGPAYLPHSLGCGAPLPTFLRISPHSQPSSSTQKWSSNPQCQCSALTQVSQAMVSWGVVLMVFVALSLLCPLSPATALFSWGFEIPPSSVLIPLSVRWLPRIQIPFLFHSSLSGVLAPSQLLFLFSLLFSSLSLPVFSYLYLPLFSLLFYPVMEGFLQFLVFWSFLLIFSSCNVKIIIHIVFFFLMCLWEKVRAMSYSSAILIHPPRDGI